MDRDIECSDSLPPISMTANLQIACFSIHYIIEALANGVVRHLKSSLSFVKNICGQEFSAQSVRFRFVESMGTADIITRASLMGKEIEGWNLRLNTAALMPAIALGTSTIAKSETPEEMRAIIRNGLQAGYRHFDTAAVYGTEHLLGEVLKEVLTSGALRREDVFITSKLGLSDAHLDDVIPAIRKSLRELQLDYVDLYMLHFPLRLKRGKNPFQGLSEDSFAPFDLIGVWKALEHSVELGLTRAVGICNSGSKILQQIAADAKMMPAVNQVEMHPGCLQPKLLDTCKQLGTILMAYFPLGSPGNLRLGEGTSLVINSPILKAIAQKHGKTVEQVALRWTLDHGAGFVCKSRNPTRLTQYLGAFGWNLDNEEHKRIETMPRFMLQDWSVWCNATTSPYRTPKEILDDWFDSDEVNVHT
ncbi:hypothetical protein R1sor_000751 [Riccia sorocarpa]|uniref:NADP-dependent oxidoreductase domain-containing protein n=1 Tax=Riccia sorocarpa TaxID=122646 RepID=A0ABD3H005_9MARC